MSLGVAFLGFSYKLVSWLVVAKKKVLFLHLSFDWDRRECTDGIFV